MSNPGKLQNECGERILHELKRKSEQTFVSIIIWLPVSTEALWDKRKACSFSVIALKKRKEKKDSEDNVSQLRWNQFTTEEFHLENTLETEKDRL